MSLRITMIELADRMWAEAKDATERKSWIEANIKKAAANEIRAALGMDPLT